MGRNVRWNDPADTEPQAAWEQEEPDFLGGSPNYDKYPGVEAEQVLVWLNID